MIGTVLQGIISSVIASVVFYIWMIIIKPRFKIADMMCISDENDDEIEYKIKVVNHSRVMLTNVSYYLVFCENSIDEIKGIRIIPPAKTCVTTMNKYTKNNTDYALRLTYCIKKSDFPLENGNHFIFVFQAYHSFSNALKIKKVMYDETSIRKGFYETGRSTKILTGK